MFDSFHTFWTAGKMEQRTKSSIVLIGIGVLCLFSQLFCSIMVTLFIIAGLYEFYHMIEKKGVNLFKMFGIVVGVFIPVTIFIKFAITEEVQFMLVVLGLFALFFLELMRKKNYQTVLSLSATVFGILYISWCLSFLIRIRLMEYGGMLLAFLILVTKLTDVGAYVVGSRYGRTQLIPRVSPNKSMEGALGGFFASILCSLVFSFLLKQIPFWDIIFMGAILGILGQLGDLFESLIKRDCDVKDSGKAIPGIGGVLDFLDSIIFTAPTFYLYMTMIRRVQQL